jgi:predicted lipoprotein with Yx(FWY)xxD motif
MRRSGLHAVRRAGLIAVLVVVLAGTAIAAAAGSRPVGTHNTKRGKVLASVHGYSLYMFQKDKRGGKSTCYGHCATVWPPLLTSAWPIAVNASGVNPKLLGTTKRSNGKLQVTYNGWPLYWYQLDYKPGQTNGEGANQFGAPWYLLNTSGNIVKPKSGGVCNPLCPGY